MVRFLLAYVIVVIVQAILGPMLGLAPSSFLTLHAALLLGAIALSLFWFSARNGRYLNGDQMIGFVAFVYSLNWLWVGFSAYWYFNSHGRPISFDESLALYLRTRGIYEAALVACFVYFAKSGVTRMLKLAGASTRDVAPPSAPTTPDKI
jgi:nitrogen fixation-related uncharacterized protein